VEKKFFKSVKVFYLANKPIATERKASFLLLQPWLLANLLPTYCLFEDNRFYLGKNW
jgi:hypothetical protein